MEAGEIPANSTLIADAIIRNIVQNATFKFGAGVGHLTDEIVDYAS